MIRVARSMTRIVSSRASMEVRIGCVSLRRNGWGIVGRRIRRSRRGCRRVIWGRWIRRLSGWSFVMIEGLTMSVRLGMDGWGHVYTIDECARIYSGCKATRNHIRHVDKLHIERPTDRFLDFSCQTNLHRPSGSLNHDPDSPIRSP